MAGTVHVLPLDHQQMRLGFWDGISMPEIYESVSDHLPKVKAMEVKDGDVFLCPYPKSGTHWLYRVIDMLQRGRPVYDSRTADSTFIDVQKIDLLSTLDAPRLFTSHLPYDRLPAQIERRRAKIVHVYRDPRAAMLSFWWMMKASMLKLGMEEFTLQAMDDMFFSDKMPYTGWFNHADQVTRYSKSCPQVPLVSISYEEMSANPKKCVQKLAEFLEVGASPQLIADIVAATSFQKQKETEEERDPTQAALKFYRKGDPKDWQNHFTDAMKAKYEEKLKERAPTCPFSATYVSP